MAATKPPGTALTPFTQFVALQRDTADLRAILTENLGGERLQASDLPQIKVPAGGGLTWDVPTARGNTPMQEIDFTGMIIMFLRMLPPVPELFQTRLVMVLVFP